MERGITFTHPEPKQFDGIQEITSKNKCKKPYWKNGKLKYK